MGMMKNVLNKNDNSNKEKKKNKNKKKEESCIIFTSPFEEPIVSLFENFYSKDRLVPLIAIASPVLCYALDWWINKETGYKFGYELLMLNGSLTFAGLMLLSGKEKTVETP